MLDGEIVAYEPHKTGAAGINSTFYVEIEPDLVAFHKRQRDHSAGRP